MVALKLNGAIVTYWNYELPIMLLVAYTFPAFAYVATLFSHSPKKQTTYAWIYFFFHFIVEAYAFIVPVIRLHS